MSDRGRQTQVLETYLRFRGRRYDRQRQARLQLPTVETAKRGFQQRSVGTV